MKHIYLGSDHAGHKLKQTVKSYLESLHIPFTDMGNAELDPGDDYPDYAYAVGKQVRDNKALGILICGSAMGVCIAANKITGVRATPVFTTREAQLSREHNDANVLCLSGWDTSAAKAKTIIRTWLKTEFSGLKRHERRVQKIKQIERDEQKAKR